MQQKSNIYRYSFATKWKEREEGGWAVAERSRRRGAGGPHKAFKAVCWRGLRGSAIEEKAWNRKAAVLTPKEGTTSKRARGRRGGCRADVSSGPRGRLLEGGEHRLDLVRIQIRVSVLIE